MICLICNIHFMSTSLKGFCLTCSLKERVTHLTDGISLTSIKHPHKETCTCSFCKEDGYP